MREKLIFITSAALLALPGLTTPIFAQNCNPQKIEAEFASKYASRIANTNGSVCATANIQIDMLEWAKDAYSRCLRGQSLTDVINELNATIDRAKRAKHDVGGC